MLPPALVSILLCIFITNTDIMSFGLFIMVVRSLSFFHLLNIHLYTELICLYPLLLQNVEATIFVRNMHIIKNCQIMLQVLFSAQFMKIYITILQILKISSYYPLDHISNNFTLSPIQFLRWKLWLLEKTTFTPFVHFLH